MILNKNDIDDAEKLYLWRTLYLGVSQGVVAEQFGMTQTALSKMEISYEERGGIPVKDEIMEVVDEWWPTFVMSISSEACLLRRREWFTKAEAAAQIGLCTYQIGQMEDPLHWREPSDEYLEWLQS